MAGDGLLRSALWASAVANAGGALLFAFPATALGEAAGLPADVPALYRAFVALFVLLFAGSYAWLAAQPVIVRPMVWFAAIGKTCAVALVVAFWLAGGASVRTVGAISGDLVLAVLFVRGLSLAR